MSRFRRRRDLTGDGDAIVGGLTLASIVIALFVITLAVAWWLGVAQAWSAGGWLALAALGAVLLSLEVLFARDYVRWRRAMLETTGSQRR
ncbi:MAG: hypothetical protein HY332_07750 [Chloroflexi bacterium]|nr:hypothetical protein [Chloroflexota bacterium]